MIKIICDVCKKEPRDMDFVFEATKAEMVDTVDVTDLKNINSRKKMDKKMYQICRECYLKHFDKLLK